MSEAMGVAIECDGAMHGTMIVQPSVLCRSLFSNFFSQYGDTTARRTRR